MTSNSEQCMNRKQFLRGPYRLAELKGYTKYFRFTIVEYNLRRVPKDNQRWAIDKDLHRIYQHDERYQAYQEDLLSLFSYDDQYDSSTPLDFLEKARTFKQRYFHEWWEEQIKASYNIRLTSEEPLSRNWPELVKRNALCPGESGNTTLYELERWQGLLQQSQRIAFLPNDRRCFPKDLITWILPFYKHHQIFLYVKEQESPFSVSEAFARHCLEQLNIPLSTVSFVPDADSAPGIRYADVVEDFYTQETCIVAKGIWNYFSLFRSDFPFIFSMNSKEDLVRGLLQKAYSPEQPDSLKAIVGYQARPFPQQVSLTGQDFNGLSLEEFLKGETPKTLSSYLKQKKKDAKSLSLLYSGKDKGDYSSGLIQYHSGFFCIIPVEGQKNSAEQAQLRVIKVEGPGKDHVYLHALLFEPSEFTITPGRFDRLTLPATIPIQEPAILSNFSYFFTENLLRMYNKSVPTEEALQMVDFPFDYIGEYHDGEFCETVPLYRKAYFGSRFDGNLFIGHLSVEEVSWEVQGTNIRIPYCAVNPGLREDFSVDSEALHTSQAVRLFTPAYPERRVGQGRSNIVLINDRIVHIFSNQDVTIPPIGVVLSIEPTVFRRRFSQVRKGARVQWRIKFREEAARHKSTLRWLYGGYNILVMNGENLATTPETLKDIFQKEGWFLSQSMRTQETQLQDGRRHPRLLLGTTEQGKIFLLAISGRTHISSGATHTESVLYCQHLLNPYDRLVNLINLDGGASVFLEALQARKRLLLNFPAPSDLNPAGKIRPNIAVLRITRSESH